jgi:hypothetical protein
VGLSPSVLSPQSSALSLSLPLLVFGVVANDANDALPADDFALRTDLLDG